MTAPERALCSADRLGCVPDENDPEPLIMRWNGKIWSWVASGAPQDTVLWDMTVLTGTNAWAVGAHTGGRPTLGGTGASSVILHWNGKARA